MHQKLDSEGFFIKISKRKAKLSVNKGEYPGCIIFNGRKRCSTVCTTVQYRKDHMETA